MSEEALKLTTYFGERSRIGGRLLADELLDIHARHEIRCSLLLRGIQGFGAKHRRRTDRLLTLSEDLPLVSIALDTPERIDTLLRDVSAIGHEGLLTLEHARICDSSSEAYDLSDAPNEATKLTVYLGRHERFKGNPAFATVCQTLHDADVSGATVLLSVDGTRNGQRKRARFFSGNADVPMMVLAIGDPQRIGDALIRLRAVLPELLFTVERVRLCKRDGELLQAPHDLAPADERGMGIQQKLTVVGSEATRYENKPVHLELVKRLRIAQAAGATSLRGIWGFHGNHAPHGDRLLSIRRHVPILTEVIDTPERIAKLFGILDELTSERGLVTSEMVPAASTLHAEHGDLARGPRHSSD